MSPRHTILLSVLFSALAAWGVVKLTVPQNTDTAARETTFERVMRTGTIQCGYVVAKEFLSFDAKTKTFSGTAYDIVETMAKNLSLKVEWVAEVSPATMAEDLKNGRYDMVCSPLTANAPRGKVMFFSRPAFFNPVYLWVHKDDPRANLDNLDWVNDKSTLLASVDGTSFANYIRREFPKATNYSLPEMSPITDMLVAVQMKKADGALTPGVSGDFFADHNDGAIVAATGKPVYVQNHHFPLPHGDEKFRNMIDVALGELIYLGTLDAIIAKYETTPPTYYFTPNRGYTAR